LEELPSPAPLIIRSCTEAISISTLSGSVQKMQERREASPKERGGEPPLNHFNTACSATITSASHYGLSLTIRSGRKSHNCSKPLCLWVGMPVDIQVVTIEEKL